MVVGTVGTVAEMVVEGVEYVIRLASKNLSLPTTQPNPKGKQKS